MCLWPLGRVCLIKLESILDVSWLCLHQCIMLLQSNYQHALTDCFFFSVTHPLSEMFSGCRVTSCSWTWMRWPDLARTGPESQMICENTTKTFCGMPKTYKQCCLVCCFCCSDRNLVVLLSVRSNPVECFLNFRSASCNISPTDVTGCCRVLPNSYYSNSAEAKLNFHPSDLWKREKLHHSDVKGTAVFHFKALMSSSDQHMHALLIT